MPPDPSTTSAPSAGLGAVLCLFVIGAIAAIIVLGARSARRGRDARAAAAWQNLLAVAHARPDAHVCRVSHVYQRAHRGSKAVILWAASGRRQDTWFWYFSPAAGSTLLISGVVGFGPHNQNPNVFYVESGGVLMSAPPGAEAAWRRFQRAAR